VARACLGSTPANARTRPARTHNVRHDTRPGIADWNGRCVEWSPGMRIVAGEIQIVPGNDAALTALDLGLQPAGVARYRWRKRARWSALDRQAQALRRCRAQHLHAGA